MSQAMLYVRSIIFWLIFLGWTLIYGILATPLLLTFSSKLIAYVGKPWSIVALWLMKSICGLHYRVNGMDGLPHRPFIIASKHESAWETIFFLKCFGNPAFVLKRELSYIPIYGWYLKPMGMIIIDRGRGISAARAINRQVTKSVVQSRVIGIFPEGTRVAHGQIGEIKPGVFLIHKAAPTLPIIPVKLNSGLFWKKNSFLIRKGIIEVTFGRKISIKGQESKAELLQKIQNSIN